MPFTRKLLKTDIEFGFIDLRFDTHPDRDPKSGLWVRHWC
ncbi:hypothetical protein AGR4C_Lc40100 [Agrobacterium tumefaciens str. Kerr 14]|uniref:Uncharacterized protein n=1 Tax=Agrobacterium tumefaciens str. Kerr 14 TaxID=1183424 RepID=A0A1S7RJZ9_AGRTU|nr:hypothetical protein AGR4B_Lc60611 [Agrobacterium tumefaciens str. CFBP 5621]CUX53601.1 hypothetical protein AGR4C_Lc40100 [Agrobacterium tumefaciens str. Kerr 14]